MRHHKLNDVALNAFAQENGEAILAFASTLASPRGFLDAFYRRRQRHDAPCVYCGAPATQRDHIPPIRHAHKHPPSAWTVVPACASCNARLGATDRTTIKEGQALLAAKPTTSAIAKEPNA